MKRSAVLILVTVILAWGCLFPQTIGFTYPGMPTKGVPPANDEYHAAFRLPSAGSGTTQVVLENVWEPTRGTGQMNSAPAAAVFNAPVVVGQVSAVWMGGTGNWNVPTNWSGGVVPNNGTPTGTTYAVFIDNGVGGTNSNVSLNIAAIVDSLTIDAGDRLGINNGLSLTVVNTGPATGTITNGGLLALNSSGSFTDLVINGNVTVSGSGSVQLSNFVGNGNRIYGGTQLSGGTVTTFVTVQNTGTLPADQVTLTAAMLGSANGIVAPSNLGTINIGASAGALVSFTTAATGSSLLKFSGTYGPGVGGSGSFSSTRRVTIP
jgi:hypothetical protein